MRLSGLRIPFVIAVMLAALPATAQTAKAPQTPSQAQMKAAVRAFVEGRNTAQNDKVRTLFADDAVIEDPVGGPIRTPDQFLFGGPGGGKNKLNLETLLVTGSNTNYATVSFIAKNPTGSVGNVLVFKFRPDGKIIELKGYFGSEDRTTNP